MVQFRPFYISGEVQTPGQFPYVPELTVLKAISVAGGIRRNADYGPQLGKDLVTAKGNFDIYDDQRVRLIVRRARIDADHGRQDRASKCRRRSQDDPRLPAIVADEMAILTSDQKKLKLKLQALDELKGVLQAEIESLEKKIINQQRQVDLAKQQLDSIGPLAQKGLIVNTRVLTSEQSIANLQGKVLDYETAILTAKQSISKATQDAIDAENTQSSSLAADRQQTEAGSERGHTQGGHAERPDGRGHGPCNDSRIANNEQPSLTLRAGSSGRRQDQRDRR